MDRRLPATTYMYTRDVHAYAVADTSLPEGSTERCISLSLSRSLFTVFSLAGTARSGKKRAPVTRERFFRSRGRRPLRFTRPESNICRGFRLRERSNVPRYAASAKYVK